MQKMRPVQDEEGVDTVKTPEEIKKGLECCLRMDCGSCPYMTMEDECRDIFDHALAYIQQLERERDAAVQCIPRACGYCKHVIDYGLSNTPGCKNPECRNISGINTGWQWRGVLEVE